MRFLDEVHHGLLRARLMPAARVIPCGMFNVQTYHMRLLQQLALLRLGGPGWRFFVTP
jgi:hypothetical protein